MNIEYEQSWMFVNAPYESLTQVIPVSDNHFLIFDDQEDLIFNIELENNNER